MLDVTLEPHPWTLFPAPVITSPNKPPATLTARLDQIARQPGRTGSQVSHHCRHLACYTAAPTTDIKLGTWEATLPGIVVYLFQ